MNEPLTSQQVEQIKVEIQTHFGTLLSGLIDKEDIVNLAEPYAINLFTRLTNSNQPIVHKKFYTGTSDSLSMPDEDFFSHRTT